jgi:hypothetical protein
MKKGLTKTAKTAFHVCAQHVGFRHESTTTLGTMICPEVETVEVKEGEKGCKK